MDANKIPEGLAEHLFASEYGWNLEYIRKLPPTDFNQHMGIFIVKYRMKAIENGTLKGNG